VYRRAIFAFNNRKCKERRNLESGYQKLIHIFRTRRNKERKILYNACLFFVVSANVQFLFNTRFMCDVVNSEFTEWAINQLAKIDVQGAIEIRRSVHLWPDSIASEDIFIRSTVRH